MASLAPYLGIIVFLILTGCGLPIPEEVPIITAGVLSSSAELNTGFAFLSCLFGAIVGDCVMYAIGYHWGHNLLKLHPRLARFVHAEREERFEKLIQQHGLKVLFAARFMVGIRGPVYLAAGVLRVSFRRFLIVDIFCATVVVSLFFGLAYLFGEPIAKFVREAELGLTILVLTGLAIVGGYFYIRGRRRLARMVSLQNIRANNAKRRQQNQSASNHSMQNKTVA